MCYYLLSLHFYYHVNYCYFYYSHYFLQLLGYKTYYVHYFMNYVYDFLIRYITVMKETNKIINIIYVRAETKNYKLSYSKNPINPFLQSHMTS